jgi:hypothetical protein
MEKNNITKMTENLLKLYFCKFLALAIRKMKRKRKGGKKDLVARHAL